MVDAILTYLFLLLLLCLPESCPQTLLLASDAGIKLLSGDNFSSTTIFSQPATSVHFRYSENDIYFISNNQILYSYYSQRLGRHAEPITTVTAAQALDDLVVDWKSYRVYYSCQATGRIYSSALVGSSPPRVVSQATDVRGLAIDPYTRTLFFIKDNTLVSFNLQSHQLYSYTSASHVVTKVIKVAVDHHTQEVFVIGSDEDLNWHLVSIDYDDSDSRLVFSGAELSQAFALDVFGDLVLWGGHCEGRRTLYTCRLSPTCRSGDLNIVLSQSPEYNKKINDAKLYNALMQTPRTDYACRQLNCSHNCTEVSLYTVRCTCPEGMAVPDGGHVCTDESPPVEVSGGMKGALVRFAEDVLEALVDAVIQWLRSLMTHLKMFIFVCCALMLTLLLCGFCLLLTTKPKATPRVTESYSLIERHVHELQE